jgi:predicted PurR-regulated permease PerM
MSSPRKRTFWKFGIWFAVAAVLAAALLLRDTLFPLFVAFGLAYACSPLVDAFERRGVSRSLVVIALLVALAGLLALFIGVLVPAVVEEMQGFIRDFPDFASKALERVADIASRYGVKLPADTDALGEQMRGLLQQEHSMQRFSPVVSVAKRLFTGVASVLIGFLNLLIIPIFFFYSLRDLHRARRYVFNLIPPRRRPKARSLFERIDQVLSGYIRGQLLVASILAVVFAIALPVLHVRFGLFIGILAGFLNIVPYLGQLTGLALSIMMALVDFEGFGRIFAIVGLFAVMNFVEGNFITPKVVGDKVGLSPLWAIISLIIGGRAAGLAGMILAIPVAGSIKVIMDDVIAGYRNSEYFNEPPSAAVDIKKG